MLKKITFLTVLALCAWGIAAFAGMPRAFAGDVAISGNARFVNITPYLDYYEDKSGELGIVDVSSGIIYSQFEPVRQAQFHAGFSDSTFWFRVRLGLGQGMGWGSRWLIEIPTMNLGEVTLYVPDFTKPDGFAADSAPSLAPGGALPDGEFLFRNIVFPISPNMGSKTIFFKIKTSGPLSAPFYVWEESAYRKAEGQRGAVFVLACGVMLGAALFSLLISGGRSWRITLCFTSMVLLWWVLLFNVRGYTLLFADAAPLILPSSILIFTLLGVLSLYFLARVMNLKESFPRLNRLTLLAMLVPVAAGAAAFFVQTGLALCWATLAVGAFMLIFQGAVSMYCLRHGFKPAIWFICCLLILYSGVLYYFASGVFWPNFGLRGLVLGWSVALGLVFACLCITVVQGLADIHKISQGESVGGLEPYDISTGLYSRLYFISRFTEEINHSRRMRQPLSLLLIDLDHLKQVNIEYGVLFSDQLIVTLGEIIKENALRFSAGGRLEGGHFGLQLPEFALHEALGVAEKIRDEFARIKFNPEGFMPASAGPETKPGTDGTGTAETAPAGKAPAAVAERKQLVQFSVCIGVVEVLADETAWEQVFKRAEEELRKAKVFGPNTISPSPDIRALF